MTAPHFCNVDLDIESKFDLAALEAELGKKVVVLHGGPVSPGCFLLRLEIVPEHDNPDDTICTFCSLLERLSAKGRRAWRSAHKKEFDVGFDAVRSQIASQFSLRTDTRESMFWTRTAPAVPALPCLPTKGTSCPAGATLPTTKRSSGAAAPGTCTAAPRTGSAPIAKPAW